MTVPGDGAGGASAPTVAGQLPKAAIEMQFAFLARFTIASKYPPAPR
jgi:hypothetical protein